MAMHTPRCNNNPKDINANAATPSSDNSNDNVMPPAATSKDTATPSGRGFKHSDADA